MRLLCLANPIRVNSSLSFAFAGSSYRERGVLFTAPVAPVLLAAAASHNAGLCHFGAPPLEATDPIRGQQPKRKPKRKRRHEQRDTITRMTIWASCSAFLVYVMLWSIAFFSLPLAPDPSSWISTSSLKRGKKSRWSARLQATDCLPVFGRPPACSSLFPVCDKRIWRGLHWVDTV